MRFCGFFAVRFPSGAEQSPRLVQAVSFSRNLDSQLLVKRGRAALGTLTRTNPQKPSVQLRNLKQDSFTFCWFPTSGKVMQQCHAPVATTNMPRFAGKTIITIKAKTELKTSSSWAFSHVSLHLLYWLPVGRKLISMHLVSDKHWNLFAKLKQLI